MAPPCRRRRFSSLLRPFHLLFTSSRISSSLAEARVGDGASCSAAASPQPRCGAGNVVRDERCLVVALSSCARLAELRFGRRTHADVVKTGFGRSVAVQGSLLNMYAKCGRLDDARHVFDDVERPDGISWTAMIGGYVQAGRPNHALRLFDRMRETGFVPDEVALVTAVTACVHLGLLEEGWALFRAMANPGYVAWNAIISGHAQNGHELEAMVLFRDMLRAGAKPTRSTLGSVVSAAANLAAFHEGRQVHGTALRRGLVSNVYVGSSLISLYTKCDALEEAGDMFEELPERNLVICNAMLAGYAHSRLAVAATELFSVMRERDEYSYVSVFCACAGEGGKVGLRMGRQLHGLALKTTHDLDPFVGNSLVDFYGKCGDLSGAARQFELLQWRDTVSWNALMVGQVQAGRDDEALTTFLCMRRDCGRAMPDSVSLTAAIGVAGGTVGLLGEQVHGLAVKLGFEASPCVGVSLVDMYGKLGYMDSAKRIFVLVLATVAEESLSEVPVNALIAGYTRNGNSGEAVRCFQEMLRRGLKPSAVTLAAVLPAAAELLHAQAWRRGLLCGRGGHVEVELVAAYLRRQGKQGDGMKLLAEIPGSERGLVLWTAAISGLAQAGDPEEALTLFYAMVGHRVVPDERTLASALGACADLACFLRGTAVHNVLARSGFGRDEHAGSALVDMYAKCGDMGAAAKAFEEMGGMHAEAVTWNTMIAGLARNGDAAEALALFWRMPAPDAVTYLAALTACSHSGLVEDAHSVLNAMAARGVSPRADHIGCMVDLLARSGQLEEAAALAAEWAAVDPEPGVAWGSVASACTVHGDGEQGVRAAEELMNARPGAAAPYLLLLRMHAERGDWDGAARVRAAMAGKRVTKRALAGSWLSAGAERAST